MSSVYDTCRRRCQSAVGCIPGAWWGVWDGDINMESAGILVIIGTVSMNEIKLGRNTAGKDKCRAEF